MGEAEEAQWSLLAAGELLWENVTFVSEIWWDFATSHKAGSSELLLVSGGQRSPSVLCGRNTFILYCLVSDLGAFGEMGLSHNVCFVKALLREGCRVGRDSFGVLLGSARADLRLLYGGSRMASQSPWPA